MQQAVQRAKLRLNHLGQSAVVLLVGGFKFSSNIAGCGSWAASIASYTASSF